MRTYDEKTMNKLAQYLYEEIQDQPGLQLLMNISSKPELVAALERAIERVQEEAIAELNKSLEQVREVWAKAGAAMAEAFSKALDANEPKQAERWKTEQTHPDCEHCEAAVEMAISDSQANGGLFQEWTVVTPGARSGPVSAEVKHKGSAVLE